MTAQVLSLRIRSDVAELALTGCQVVRFDDPNELRSLGDDLHRLAAVLDAWPTVPIVGGRWHPHRPDTWELGR